MSLMESHFLMLIRNWINFRLRSFLHQGALWQNIQAAVSYKLSFLYAILTENVLYLQYSSVPNRFFSVGMYRIIAFCLRGFLDSQG